MGWAWCSVKILLLGAGALLVLDAMGNLAIRLKKEVLGLGLLSWDRAGAALDLRLL